MGVVTEFSPSGADLRPDLGTTFGDARLGDPVTHSTPLELSEKTARATRGQIGNGNDNISSADTESGVEMERLW